MRYYERNTGKNWTSEELSELCKLAKEETPPVVIGVLLARTKGSVQRKARDLGIALKPSVRLRYRPKRKLTSFSAKSNAKLSAV